MKNYRDRYGYKVCYLEEGKQQYIRYFKTYTYKQAINARICYMRCPPTAREDGHKLIKPKWKIVPISRREVIDGIWREVPF